MVQDKIAFQITPKPLTKKAFRGFLFFGCIGIFTFLITRSWSLAMTCIIIWVIELAIDAFQYDGWQIKKDEIIVLCDWIGGIRVKNIKFADIRGITYYAGGRYALPSLTFKLIDQNVRCYTHISIFDLADTLLYFQSKGISIKLIPSDAEIQLYLDGKIQSLPMTND